MRHMVHSRHLLLSITHVKYVKLLLKRTSPEWMYIGPHIDRTTTTSLKVLHVHSLTLLSFLCYAKFSTLQRQYSLLY